MIYEFSPKQDLHGYSKPWAPGAGVNLYDKDTITDNAYITSVGVETPNIEFFCSDYIPITPETDYYLYTDTNGRIDTIKFFDSDKIYLSGSALQKRVVTTPADCYYVRINAIKSHITPAEVYFNYPATETAYSPYANICPPEGYGIWDPSNNEMIQVYSGYVDAEARKLYLHPVYEEYDGEELVGPWISSMDEYTEEGTPTTGAFVVDFGGEVTEYVITDFMLQTLLDSLGIRRFITSGAMLLNSLMDQAQGRVRSEEELLNRSFPIHVIAIGKDLPSNLVIKKPVSDVLPVLPGKIKI